MTQFKIFSQGTTMIRRTARVGMAMWTASSHISPSRLINVGWIYWPAPPKWRPAGLWVSLYKKIKILLKLEETILYFLLRCFSLHPIKLLLVPHQFRNLIFITRKSIPKIKIYKRIFFFYNNFFRTATLPFEI